MNPEWAFIMGAVMGSMIGSAVATLTTMRLWFDKPARQMFLEWRMRKEVRDAGFADTTASRPGDDADPSRRRKARLSGRKRRRVQ